MTPCSCSPRVPWRSTTRLTTEAASDGIKPCVTLQDIRAIAGPRAHDPSCVASQPLTGAAQASEPTLGQYAQGDMTRAESKRERKRDPRKTASDDDGTIAAILREQRRPPHRVAPRTRQQSGPR